MIFKPLQTLLVAQPAPLVSTATFKVATTGTGDGDGDGSGLTVGIGDGLGLETVVGVGLGVGSGTAPFIAKLVLALLLSNATPVRPTPPLKTIV